MKVKRKDWENLIELKDRAEIAQMFAELSTRIDLEQLTIRSLYEYFEANQDNYRKQDCQQLQDAAPWGD